MTEHGYTRKVINNNGNVLFLPRVDDAARYFSKEVTFNPYVEAAGQEFPLGSVMKSGRNEFIYNKNGSSALAIATPIQGAARVHAEQDDDIVVGAAAAIGDFEVELTSTANLDNSPNNTANEFRDGYLVVNDEAGEGQMFRIKSNDALSTTDNATFTLYDPLTIALTTSSQVGIVRCPNYRTVLTGAALTAPFMGVTLIPITASYFFWSKIKGVAPIVAHAAIAVGAAVAVGITAGKADPTAHDGTYGLSAASRIIGYAWTPAIADTETFLVDLS
jgi:hypothetical protein